MIKINRRVIFKRDIIDVYFDNDNYEIIVYLNDEIHKRCDEVTIYCDNKLCYLWNVLKIRIKLLIF